jgi:hypothetical protein
VSAFWSRRARTTWSGIFRWCRRRKNRGEGVRGGNDGGLGPFETLERSISYLFGGLLEMRGDRSLLVRDGGSGMLQQREKKVEVEVVLFKVRCVR